MSSNETWLTTVLPPYMTEEKRQSLMRSYWLYCVEGTLLIIFNVPVVGAVLKHEILRENKAYIFAGGLALTDASSGLGTLLAGSIRNYLLYTDQVTNEQFVSRWSCFWAPWNLLHNFTDILCYLMLFVISVDRLFMIVAPIRYITIGMGYAWGVVGGAYGWVLLGVLYAASQSYDYQQAEFPKICYTQMGYDPAYYLYYQLIRPISTVLSVVLYGLVWALYMTGTRCESFGSKSTPNNIKTLRVGPATENTTNVETMTTSQGGGGTGSKKKVREQRRMTVTLGISSLFTTVFVAIPLLVKLYVVYADGLKAPWMIVIIPYTFIIQNLNPMANFFIYILRHKNMRLGIKCLFTGKELTDSMLKN